MEVGGDTEVVLPLADDRLRRMEGIGDRFGVAVAACETWLERQPFAVSTKREYRRWAAERVVVRVRVRMIIARLRPSWRRGVVAFLALNISSGISSMRGCARSAIVFCDDE